MKLGKSIDNKHYNHIYDILYEEVTYEIHILRKNVDSFINNITRKQRKLQYKN